MEGEGKGRREKEKKGKEGIGRRRAERVREKVRERGSICLSRKGGLGVGRDCLLKGQGTQVTNQASRL